VAGPPDGRYLLRTGPVVAAERVVVLATVYGERPRRRRRARRVRQTPEPSVAPTLRATVISTTSVTDRAAGEKWIKDQRRDHGERAIADASRALNAVVGAYRLAAADATVHELSTRHLLRVRIGYGRGEQVASGRWAEALELAPPRARRGAALQPQERLAWLLSGRDRALACEEFALRARSDLEAGRHFAAAAGLSTALRAAPNELRDAGEGAGMDARLAELATLAPAVAAQAATLEREVPGAEEVAQLEHALERLAAALRARTAFLLDDEP